MKSLVCDFEDVCSVASENVSDSINSESTRITPRNFRGSCDNKTKFGFSDMSQSTFEIADEILKMLSETLAERPTQEGMSSDEELPEDTHPVSMLEKLTLTKSLVSKVCQGYLDLLVAGQAKREEPESKACSALMRSKTKSVVLSQEDCEAICELLRTPDVPPQPKAPFHFSKLQAKYADLGQKFQVSQTALRQKEEENEHLTETNTRLRSSCKTLTQQLKSMERQLTFTVEEAYRLEGGYSRLMAELSAYRAFDIPASSEAEAPSNLLGNSYRGSFMNGVRTPSFTSQSPEGLSFAKYL
jgi:hypothetical protein